MKKHLLLTLLILSVLFTACGWQENITQEQRQACESYLESIWLTAACDPNSHTGGIELPQSVSRDFFTIKVIGVVGNDTVDLMEGREAEPGWLAFDQLDEYDNVQVSMGIHKDGTGIAGLTFDLLECAPLE